MADQRIGADLGEPDAVTEETALTRMERNVYAKFKPGQPIMYSSELGPEATFYRWRKEAGKAGKLAYSGGLYYRPHAQECKVC